MGVVLRASSADYQHQLQALLPRGPAWLEDDPRLSGEAIELARIHNRVLDLLAEADSRTTFELFAEWEAEYGLPDPCAALLEEQSQAARRAALIAKVIGLGGQSRAFYIALALSLSYAITISEFVPHTVADDVDHAIYGEVWAYAWQVNAALSTVTEITVEDDVDQRIRSWGNELLECVLERVRPAHTVVIFSYA